MTACDGYGYTVSVTAGAVHIRGTITGHWMARLCLGGKMLEHLTTVLLRDWWAKPRSKEQKWQVWVPSQTQKQASYTGTELDRSLKHMKGRPASWHIYISWDRKITLLQELMAQGYFLFASNSAHKTLALSNLKRPGPEMKISMTPLLEADEGTFPRPPSPEMMTTQQLLKTWPEVILIIENSSHMVAYMQDLWNYKEQLVLFPLLPVEPANLYVTRFQTQQKFSFLC